MRKRRSKNDNLLSLLDVGSFVSFLLKRGAFNEVDLGKEAELVPLLFRGDFMVDDNNG